jgi:hypothetical protein
MYQRGAYGVGKKDEVMPRAPPSQFCFYTISLPLVELRTPLGKRKKTSFIT